MPVIDLLDSVNQKFNNVVSGLTATNAKAAIDEIVANIAALTKSDVGLGNVDNTSDLGKPVSTATQTALDDKVDDAQVLTNVPAGALFTDTIYSHPTGDGNLHVPANGVSNDGKVLTASAVAGVMTWETPAVTYVHPSYSTTNIDTTGATIVDAITTTAEGHISAMSTRVLTLADLGYTGETNATADQSAAEILALLLTVDGNASGLDADLFDGANSSQFLRSDVADTKTAGNLTLNDSVQLRVGAGSDLRLYHDGANNFMDLYAGDLSVRDGGTQRFTFARATGSFHATGNITADGTIDATTLDGIDSASFMRSDTENAVTATQIIRRNGVASPSYINGQLELRTTDSNDVSMGFHRSGYTACQLRHVSNGLILSGSARTTAADFYSYGNITAYSDERLKTDINKIQDALNKTSQLSGYTFKRTNAEKGEEDRVHTGVIAQEVQRVLPEAVSVDDEGMLSVAYGNMMGLAIEAIKELKARVEELEGR